VSAGIPQVSSRSRIFRFVVACVVAIVVHKLAVFLAPGRFFGECAGGCARADVEGWAIHDLASVLFPAAAAVLLLWLAGRVASLRRRMDVAVAAGLGAGLASLLIYLE